MAAARTLLAFSRPHTIVGTTLSILGLWVLAVAHAEPPDPRVGAALLALVAALATNVYIVGLNQLTDVEIDRINKPWLPIAAGRLSVSAGRAIVLGCAVAAVASAAIAGPWMLGAVVAGLAVGTAYSLPPLRLKRFHLWAAASITGVRGLVVNLLVFAHFADVLTGRPAVPVHIRALTGMVLGLGIVIAWFKDIPDMEGDRRHAIRTLTLRLGARATVNVGVALLAACYGALIVAGWRGLAGVNGAVLAGAHAVLLVATVVAAARVRLDARASVVRFYLFIWGLFFAEYLVFPAAGVLA